MAVLLLLSRLCKDEAVSHATSAVCCRRCVCDSFRRNFHERCYRSIEKAEIVVGGKGCPAPAPPDAYASPTSKYNAGGRRGRRGGSLPLLSCFRLPH